MDTTARLAVFIPIWVAVGLVTALVMRRRGHDLAVWAAIGVIFGPFAVALASHQVRRALYMRPRAVSAGRLGPGHNDLLIGIDGSEQACATARAVVDRFGPGIRRLTLAAVVDADESVARQQHSTSMMWELDHPHEDACRRQLEAVTRQLADVEPETIILAGDPATALGRHARDHGFDFVVVGPRGRGASKAILGSVAQRLARTSPVPVIIGPRTEPSPPSADGDVREGRPRDHADH